jgi:hypothetical protein
MDQFEKIITQYQTIITVLGKIFGAMLGVGLFIRFIYGFTVKYFENLHDETERIKKIIWGPDGEPEKGLEHRLTDLERSHNDRINKDKQCKVKQ